MHCYFIVSLFAFYIGYISASETEIKPVTIMVQRFSEQPLRIMMLQDPNQIDLYYVEDGNSYCTKTKAYQEAPKERISFDGIKGKNNQLFEKISAIKEPIKQWLGNTAAKLLLPEKQEDQKLHDQFSQIFKELLPLNFMFSWTIQNPTTFYMVVNDVHISYPEKTTVGELKKMIYAYLAARADFADPDKVKNEKIVTGDDSKNASIVRSKKYKMEI